MFVLSLAEVTDPKYGFEANGYGTQDSHNLYQNCYPSSSRAATRTDFAKSDRATFGGCALRLRVNGMLDALNTIKIAIKI